MNEVTQQFQDVVKRWLDDAYVPKRSHIPPVLYHYTDAGGLAGTLRSGTVWATDSRFLNDREELKHSRNSARTLLQAEALGCKDPILTRLYKEILEYQKVENETSYFVYSLTGQKDDLSQWRGYANEGRGFTIGFSGPDLLKLSEPDSSEFGFAKVEYGHDVQDRVLKDALEDIRKLLVKLLKEPNVNKKTVYNTASYYYDGLVNARAAVNKHRSFSREQEWRTVTQVAPVDSNDINVRLSGDKLVPYITLDLRGSENKKLPILEIGIGPGFDGEYAIPVRHLCRETGYSPEIYYADTPYRRN